MKQVFHCGHCKYNSSHLHNSYATRDSLVKTQALQEWSLRSERVDFYIWIFPTAVFYIFPRHFNKKNKQTKPERNTHSVITTLPRDSLLLLRHTADKKPNTQQAQLFRSALLLLYNFFPDNILLWQLASGKSNTYGLGYDWTPSPHSSNILGFWESKSQLKDEALFLLYGKGYQHREKTALLNSLFSFPQPARKAVLKINIMYLADLKCYPEKPSSPSSLLQNHLSNHAPQTLIEFLPPFFDLLRSEVANSKFFFLYSFCLCLMLPRTA